MPSKLKQSVVALIVINAVSIPPALADMTMYTPANPGGYEWVPRVDANNVVAAGDTLTIDNEAAVNMGDAIGSGMWMYGTLNVTNSTINADSIEISKQDGANVSPQATIDDSTLNVASGLNIYDGRVVIHDSTINGALGAGRNDGDFAGQVSIEMAGSTVNGIVSIQNNATVSLDNSRIIADKNLDPGEPAGNGVTIDTGGTLSLDNHSSVQGATGIVVEHGNGDAPVLISISNESDVTSSQGSAITVSQGGQYAQTTIDVTNDAQLHGANGMILSVGDAYYGVVDFNVANAHLNGNIAADEVATLNVRLSGQSSLNGAITGADRVEVDSSEWRVTGPSTVGTLTGANGAIEVAPNQMLTVGTINGNGTLSTQAVEMGTAAQVHVTDTMEGQWKVNGYDAQPNHADADLKNQYLLVQVDGANTAAVSGTTDIGAYSYANTVDANGDIVAVREVVPADPGTGPDAGAGTLPALNPGAIAAVDAMSVSSTRAIWDTQFSALHLREQALRSSAPARGSFWAQTYGGNYKLDNGYSDAGSDVYDTTVKGLSIGIDKALLHNDAMSVYGGIYASFVGARRSATESDGKSRGYSVGGYATWMHQTGWYVESMFAYGSFDNQFSAAYNDPLHPTVNVNDWRGKSGAIALEAGRAFALADGWTIQPAVGIRTVIQSGEEATTDLGHTMSSDHVSSSGANVSLTVSKALRRGDAVYRPYVRIGYGEEFNGTQKIHYAGASIDTTLDASRAFVNAGVSASLNAHNAVYVDCQYQKGRNVDRTYGVQLGYQYAF